MRDAGHDNAASVTRAVGRAPRKGLLASLRIRKKLLLLHKVFSLALAVTLLLALRPTLRDLVARTEEHECSIAIELALAGAGEATPGPLTVRSVSVRVGAADELGLSETEAAAVMAAPGHELAVTSPRGGSRVVRWDRAGDRFVVATARSPEVRAAVRRIDVLIVVSMLGAYGLIALALEVFVLPRQVYQPIRRLLLADEAVRTGERGHEVIPESEIPADEMGMIMRSRNESIERLRAKEVQLSDALEKLEEVANDLKRKNHLLEATRQNMADQDRLVSLGMMSAGLAHELNTPLAVLKGSVEKLAESPRAGVDDAQAQLMLRVVSRLERLSESLLDFARVRPPRHDTVRPREVVDEAWTLVRLDRDARNVAIENAIDPALEIIGDADRLTQVFVNLLRNACDAMDGRGRVRVSAQRREREGVEWVTVYCADDGPGIDPGVLPTLFEPFTSTRLDAKGTGLGLAVAEGIVREHGGMLLAGNARGGGAVFEVMLPVTPLASGRAAGHDGGQSSVTGPDDTRSDD